MKLFIASNLRFIQISKAVCLINEPIKNNDLFYYDLIFYKLSYKLYVLGLS